MPVITPAGGLGAHLNAGAFLSHIPQTQYPAGALAAALYLVGGIRGMERGSISEQRDANGNETYANMELLRLAAPRRVFTMSQLKFVVDRHPVAVRKPQPDRRPEVRRRTENAALLLRQTGRHIGLA